jgi:energy-coupling factor transport system ATP-binding protein
MDEAIFADRILVMDQGKIVLEGTPKEVFPQVEVLRQLGLDVPQVTLLAYELSQKGLDVPTACLTVEELVNALCQLKS